MITDTDEHIKETIFDEQLLDMDLIKELGFTPYAVTNLEEHDWGERHFISPNHKILLSVKILISIEFGAADRYIWTASKVGARRYTQEYVETVGDVKEFIKKNAYDNRQ